MASIFDFIKKQPANASEPPMAPPAPQVVQAPSMSTTPHIDPAAITPAAVPAPAAVNQQPAPHQAPAPMKPSVSAPLTSHIAPEKREEIDIMTHLTQRSNRVIMAANTKAKNLQNTFIDSEHVLHGLLTDGEIYTLLTELKIQPQIVEQELAKVYKAEKHSGNPQVSPRVKRIIDASLVIARKLGFEFIAPEHLLVALFEEGEGVGAQVLVKMGLKKEALSKAITGKKEGLSADQEKAQRKKSVLEKFTIDLTAKASSGQLDPVVERSEVIERVIHILSRRTKNNPSLVGEAGVGKTAIVEGLAEKIVAKQVPEPLLNKRILQLDLMSILAGASHRGEFEERMKDLIEEVQASKGEIILFIDEIHNIVGAGASGEGSLDASNFLKPALARGEIQLIGATTLTEYRKYIEKDPALERRFQPVLVPEPTEEQAIKMLKAIKDKYEAFHKVQIPAEAITAAVKYSKRYVGDRFLPDKAVDLIDEAASAVRLPLISLPEEMKSLEDRVHQLTQEMQEAQKKNDKVKARILNSKISEVQSGLNEKKQQYNLKKAQSTAAVSEEIIKDIVARWTGIPVSKITGSETERLANLEKIMHERLVGQNDAVTVVAQAVRRGRAGLKSTARPIGSFVFLGPTGVGKTELAKTLADILFGTEESMIRFDMTEYMEKHEVAKLLGAPPGYVGYEEGGKLTEAVRRRPYSVVLFDEIEKAHPDIFNILLQILDDGRLTDNKGHTISFKNTVVICTSNIGTKIIQDELIKQWDKELAADGSAQKPNGKPVADQKQTTPQSYQQIKNKVMDELMKFFRPELVNRFDEVIVFEPLQYKDMVFIVKLQLKSVGKLLEDQDMGFVFTDDAVKEIVRAGFDPIFGARPLRRAIQKLVENPLSTLIIEKKLKMGDTVKVDFNGKDFIFAIEQIQAPVAAPVAMPPRHFQCQVCHQEFDTALMKNSTVVCAHCGSKNVTRVSPAPTNGVSKAAAPKNKPAMSASPVAMPN